MHATDVTVREKNVSNAPVRIAPNTLVATNSIANNTTDKRIVPSIPAIRTGSTEQIHSRRLKLWIIASVIGVIAR